MCRVSHLHLLVLLTWFSTTYPATRGVVVVPVADVVAEPLAERFGTAKVNEAYAALPYAPSDDPTSCPRIHQLLFNETVDIIQEQGSELQIGILNAFWYDGATGARENRGWTQKKNIKLLEALSSARRFVPPPITPDHPENMRAPGIITLSKPLYDQKNNRHFSVGTRFVTVPLMTPTEVARAMIPCYDEGAADTIDVKDYISRDALIASNKALRMFVQLLRNWTSLQGKVVPYVWGGLNLTHGPSTQTTGVTSPAFEQRRTPYGIAITRGDHGTHPKAGFDCSGIILRAAQACSIPYFFKNTTTAGKHLRPLADGEELENGDLILIPGHVMIVSDMAHNKLIDACGYIHGYGQVREIELEKVFRGIRVYEEMIARSKTTYPTEFLGIDGQTTKRFDTITLLKMRSTWHGE